MAFENAELRQQVSELEKEVSKLRRKLDGKRKREEPIESFQRAVLRDQRNSKKRRYAG